MLIQGTLKERQTETEVCPRNSVLPGATKVAYQKTLKNTLNQIPINFRSEQGSSGSANVVDHINCMSLHVLCPQLLQEWTKICGQF